jgi:branched-chain amino acid transport system substrate-binding protein
MKTNFALWTAVCATAFLSWPATCLAQSVPGITDKEILIGSCAALEGPSSFLGRETVTGAEAYFQAVNDEGGVHGRKPAAYFLR